MSVTIKTTTGRADLSKSRWFIHGIEKIGKSNLAAAWPNGLFLATEQRLQHLPGVKYIDIDSWNKYLDAIKVLESPKMQEAYKTIVTDVVDLAYQFCVAHVGAQGVSDKKGGKVKFDHRLDLEFGRAYDAVDSEFKKAFFKLLTLPYGLIFISHTKTEEVKGLGGVVRTKSISTLEKRAKNIILPHMGVIGHMRYEEKAIKDKVTGKAKMVRLRVLDFEGSESVEAGDGEGYLPKQLTCHRDGKQTYDSIAKYYAGTMKKGGGTIE